MKRRSFARTLAFGLGAALAAQATWSTIRFARAPVSYGPPRKRNVGPLESFAIGTIVLVEHAQVFIKRDADGIRAMSSTCTHLGCTVRREDNEFVCPCHGSRYDEEGHVVDGPAPAALGFYRIEANARGQLVVDLGHPVSPDYRLRNA